MKTTYILDEKALHKQTVNSLNAELEITIDEYENKTRELTTCQTEKTSLERLHLELKDNWNDEIGRVRQDLNKVTQELTDLKLNYTQAHLNYTMTIADYKYPKDDGKLNHCIENDL